MKPRSPRVVTRLLALVVPSVLLLLAGEVVVRVHYWRFRGYDYKWLIIPLGWSGLPYGATTPTLPLGLRSHDVVVAAEGRTVRLTVNAQMGRGADWTLKTPSSPPRILCLGGSSTFGVYNPDGATWPAFLQGELEKRYGRPIEVLNGGRPSGRLGPPRMANAVAPDLLKCLSVNGDYCNSGVDGRSGRRWLDYQPDIVVFYEAYNNCPADLLDNAEEAITKFHKTGLGRSLSRLHYVSMLYTYLVEKSHFVWLANRSPMREELGRFRARLRELARLVRQHGATPIFVLQVFRYAEDPRVRRLALETDEEIRAFVKSAAKAGARDPAEQKDRLFVYNAQVLVEAVRREGAALGVQVIDPRPAFSYDREGAAPLLIDEVHLRDEGNHVLAQAIASQLDLSKLVRREGVRIPWEK